MTESRFEPGPLAEVECIASGTRWTLVFVRELRHSPEKVWAALTEPAQLESWAPFVADRDLGHAGPVTLTHIDGAERVDLPSSVLHAEPPVLLEYGWGSDVLRWELTPTATGTRLTLRHTTDEQAMVAKVAAGWHLCLVVAEHLLDGQPIAPIRGNDAMNYGWEQLHDEYARHFTIAGCMACALADGRLPLPGGSIHATQHWLVEHCIGPLGLGALIVKPRRHVTAVADLTEAEASELGALLQRASAVARDLVGAAQVYNCLWSHAGGVPVHIHYVVQPVTEQQMTEFGAHGPMLQVAMLQRAQVPTPADVERVSDEARRRFVARIS